MIKILFICHGNICRSPMAEFVMRDMVQRKHLSPYVTIASAATSTEEIGNPVHRGTVRKLAQYGISTEGKYAVQMRKSDYVEYDYLIAMDRWNLRNIMKLIRYDPEHKVHLLLDFTNQPGEIADPWYTGNFDVTYEDIKRGCQGLLDSILQSGRWKDEFRHRGKGM